MKHQRFWFSMVGLSLIVLFSGLGAFAQQPASGNCVLVADGDNLYTIEGAGYEHLSADNPGIRPSLNSPERKFTTKFGQPGVKIWPGETICGVRRQGHELVLTPAAPAAIKPATADASPALQTADRPTSKAAQMALGGLMLFLLLVIAAIVLITWFLRRRDPAGLSAHRFAYQGVQPEQANAYADGLAAQVHPGRPFVIVSQTRQRARGAVISEYINPARRETVILDGGPNSYVYRTQVRFTDVTPNEDVEMPFLQSCGNPIRYGTLARWVPGLTFEYLGEPETIAPPVAAAPEPATEPEPAPATRAQQRTSALAGIELAEQEDGPAFKMTRLNEDVVIELVAADEGQFMLSVPASAVNYDGTQFTFTGSKLPAITIPVPAMVVAMAAVQQLTAPVEITEAEQTAP